MISEILLMSHVHSLNSSEVFIIWYRGIIVAVLCQCRYWWGERLFCKVSCLSSSSFVVETVETAAVEQSPFASTFPPTKSFSLLAP